MSEKGLILGERLEMQAGSTNVISVVPSLDQEKKFKIPINSIPHRVFKRGKFNDDLLRFVANVEINSKDPEQLEISNAENLDLQDIFK
jgi:hypothetical protein